MSPGFTPRPSLSVRVAASDQAEAVDRVSPGFTPRPSLSGVEWSPPRVSLVGVSPGFTPRPSLSAVARGRVPSLRPGGVAGVHAPAFVERAVTTGAGSPKSASVAGVHAPAFVERAVTTGAAVARRLPIAMPVTIPPVVLAEAPVPRFTSRRI